MDTKGGRTLRFDRVDGGGSGRHLELCLSKGDQLSPLEFIHALSWLGAWRVRIPRINHVHPLALLHRACLVLIPNIRIYPLLLRGVLEVLLSFPLPFPALVPISLVITASADRAAPTPS